MKAVRPKRQKEMVRDEDYEALATFRHLLRQFLMFSETAARDAGITPQQHQAILALKGRSGKATMTIGELSEQLLIRHHSAVELVNRLEIANLIIKSEAKKDRRQVVIALTSRAQTILKNLSKVHLAELRRSRPFLIQFAKHLEKIN